MRTPITALLASALLAWAGPVTASGPVQAPSSRVENRSTHAWRVGMGFWVAGEIRVHRSQDHAELARLKNQGDNYILGAGEAVDLKVLPTRNGLALQVTFRPVDGRGTAANVYISQGNPGDRHTLNVNDAPTVQVDKTCYGRSEAGPFVVIQ